MNARIHSLIWGILCFPLAAALARPQEPADAIIARVNGDAILVSQLKEAALDQNVPISALTVEGLRGEGYRRAITVLVDEALLVQQAKAEDLKVDEMTVSNTVDEMIATLRKRLGSEDQLSAFFKQYHLDLASLRRLLTERERRDSLATEVVAKRVTVDQPRIEAFVADHRARRLPLEEVKLAQIMINCPAAEQSTPPGKELLLKALKAAREAGAAPDKFGELVDKYSDDPAGQGRGGLLGWMDPATLRPPLAESVRKLEVGQISPPLASDDGYHIIQMLGRHTQRDLCFAEEFARQRALLIVQLRRQANIQLFDLEGHPITTIQWDDRETTASRSADFAGGQ